ncbi:ubinuclein-2a isoform X2 [Amia ocellicauda]|uniref:ubinuclein-2a isoform X2 n=1 Tax=Amia ocellicauda TaxID=2972642 RepID=UPI003464D4F5
MAEPRKVPFVTLSSPEPRKRRREDDTASPGDSEPGAAARFGKEAGGEAAVAAADANGGQRGITVRLNLRLSEPSDQASAEFNYSELLQSLQVKKPDPIPADPADPFNDDERDRQQVEALAKKFEAKYGCSGKKKRKDRLQDLIDIGFGYDETDPFIDNSEAYDELVPASLTTKLGGFYINTGTLQFRQASESEGEEGERKSKHFRMKDGEERGIKKRKRKEEGSSLEKEKKPRKNRVPKQLGVSSLRPDKKKRKKLLKDSLSLAAMLRRFTREKEEMPRKHLPNATPSNPPRPPAAPPVPPTAAAAPPAAGDLHDFADPSVISLLGSTNESDMLQDLLGDLDLEQLLDSEAEASENGLLGAVVPAGGQKAGLSQRQAPMLLTPPPLPDGLPAPLIKRIEDLRAASRQFDEEGRKKFFTLDMNNILLDIELQVQEQSAEVRAAVYSHLEAFVPCNKDTLLKRLKKLNLNIQDDRLRTPLLKLKLAVCSVMPEQIARYNLHCQAHAAKQSEEGEKVGSEDDDEERPGRRVMGPRKKFVWDDGLRTLLCNLVRVKLGCYALESQCTLSPEDYLKSFMEAEVKPLWPKGWMQARMLFKESRSVHSHLTGNLAKKKIVPTPKTKPRDGMWMQRTPQQPPHTPPVACSTPQPLGVSAAAPAPSQSQPRRPTSSSPPETICLDDSLDEALAAPSLDSISHALALLSSAARGLVQSDSSPPSPPAPQPPAAPPAKRPRPPTPSPSYAVKREAPTPPATSTSPSVSSPSPSARPPASSPSARPPTSSLSISGVSGATRTDCFSLVRTTASTMAATVATASAHGQHRHAHPHLQRPATSANPTPKLLLHHPHSSPAASAASPSALQKPRPPPTASPLLPPSGAQSKLYPPPSGKSLTPTGGGGAKAGHGTTPPLQHRLTPPAHKAQQLPSTPSRPPQGHPKNTPPSPSARPPHHHQSNFITPMQATLTKASRSLPPIVKLTNALQTPRPPPATSAPAPPPSSVPSQTTSSPSLSLPRAQVTAVSSSSCKPNFRPPYAVQGVAGKAGQGSGLIVGGPKCAPPSSSSNTSSNTSSNPTPSPLRPAPSQSPSANHRRSCPSPAQRSSGIVGSGVKPIPSRVASTAPSTQTTLTQVTSAASLLGSPPSLPLLSAGGGGLGAFGMLGGLVPVSLPFQFPLDLLNFSPSGASTPSASPNSGYTLAQNLLKSLQSGSPAALPPHLQHMFTDSSQSQGGEVKRKTH